MSLIQDPRHHTSIIIAEKAAAWSALSTDH